MPSDKCQVNDTGECIFRVYMSCIRATNSVVPSPRRLYFFGPKLAQAVGKCYSSQSRPKIFLSRLSHGRPRGMEVLVKKTQVFILGAVKFIMTVPD